MNGICLKRLACLLLCVLALQLCGCEALFPSESGSTAAPTETAGAPAPAEAGAVDLMTGITPNPPAPVPVTDRAAAAATDFGLRLFLAAGEPGENALLSPVSVLCALAMTANGAQGDTLSQMETVLGLSRAELNDYFRAWMASCEGDSVLKPANSVWFTDDPRFTVNRDFLQTNADHYGADVYRAAFDDDTLSAINEWVRTKTDGMIPSILDRIPKSAVMYLINALAFDARWETPYSEYSVQEGRFSCADGKKRNVDFLCSEEALYLETGTAVGFLKPYAGGKYAFAALLPEKGTSPEEYLASLDGAQLHALLTAPQSVAVDAALPKFEMSYDTELSEILRGMGMKLPFAPAGADFSGLGVSTGGNIYISRVLHKSYIAVDEAGTRAGAATAVEAADEAAPMERKRVYLDRPFVCMLLDTKTGVPFFLGVLNDPGK